MPMFVSRRLIRLGGAKSQTLACICGDNPEIDPQLTFPD